MATVLHIQCSPKRQRSGSAKMAAAFLEHYQQLNPNDEISRLSLFEADLPEFGEDLTTAKFAPIFGDTLNQKQKDGWQVVVDLISDFDRADKIVLSTPMWNGSVPYKLKHYIDILVQPLLSFGFDEETGEHFGLLRDRPLQFVLTRSSVSVGDPFDNQMPYLKSVFDFVGIKDHRFIVAESTTQPTAEARANYIESFTDQLQTAAESF